MTDKYTLEDFLSIVNCPKKTKEESDKVKIIFVGESISAWSTTKVWLCKYLVDLINSEDTSEKKLSLEQIEVYINEHSLFTRERIKFYIKLFHTTTIANV